MKYKDFKLALDFLIDYGFEKLFGILIHPDYLKNNM